MTKTLTQSQVEYIQRTKQARENRPEIKQEHVADAIGVDRVTYTGYETRRTMPQKYISRFCAFLGVTEKWLLTGEGSMTETYTGQRKEIMDKISAMPEWELQKLIQIVDLLK